MTSVVALRQESSIAQIGGEIGRKARSDPICEAGIETIRHEGRSEQDSEDAHVRRALELMVLGDFVRAGRVIDCNNPASPFPTQRCKLRCCPTCGDETAKRIAKKAARLMLPAPRRRAVIVSFCSFRLDDLGETISGFRAALVRLRRRAIFRPVKYGVGAVETKLAENGRQWTVHAHVALGYDGKIDWDLVAAQWREITKSRGSFKLHRQPVITNFGRDFFADYACKSQTWSPEPGSMPLGLFDTVRRAVHGRRLLIAWGFRRKVR